ARGELSAVRPGVHGARAAGTLRARWRAASLRARMPGPFARPRMTTMRAVELYAPGKFRLRNDVPIPEPGPDEVRIKGEADGICGTVVHICSDDPSMREIVKAPVILGHEVCGVVDKLGRDAKGLEPGQYVSAEMHEVCYSCPACRDGQYHACSKTKIRGV